MERQFTAGAQRALAAADQWATPPDPDTLAAPALLLGLLAESECRAAIILARHGIDAAAVHGRWPELTPRPAAAPPRAGRFSPEVETAMVAAAARLRDYPQPLELATEHLLLGLAAAEEGVSRWLRRQGVDPCALEAEIHRLYGHRPGPPPLDADLPPSSESGPSAGAVPPASAESAALVVEAAEASTTTGVLRLLDAAANRAREGLRVVEDYARFVLDDRHLTAALKQLRHDLAAALARLPVDQRLAARETLADVGTGLTTPSEQQRPGKTALLTANFLRLQEGLRSLEEAGKLHDSRMAAAVKQLRYRAYTLQRALEITANGLDRLRHARLYVLIDGRASLEEFEALARPLIAADVHAIQLRDKRLGDRCLLERARLLRQWTAGSRTLLVINDRADLAALARADGVHLGQEELTVKDARAVVGPEALVGVSTHSIEQARQAVLDGASYVGVGPVFPSGTKQFADIPGVELLHAVAAEIRLPAFAIGGITRDNLAQVLSAGFGRIAVSGAITGADDPAAAARELLAALEGPEPGL